MDIQNPFPGMNPYLEHPRLWPDVHNRLIAAMADALTAELAPHYYVGLESRAYIIKSEGDSYLGRPDVAVVASVVRPLMPTAASPVSQPLAKGARIVEAELEIGDEVSHYYLEIRAVKTDELITVIELLSPVNKVDSRGRADYVNKRDEILYSQSNYIEIDLLRVGEPLPLRQQVASTYRMVVSRSWHRPHVQLFLFEMLDPIPDLPIPLRQDEPEPMLALNQLLQAVYERARFDLRIDYKEQAVPPLDDSTAVWLKKRLDSR